jgi:release factor glutamine methyltransferase
MNIALRLFLILFSAPLDAQVRVEIPSQGVDAAPVITPAPKSSMKVSRWEAIEDFTEPIAILPTVFWEPLDTVSLRKLIREQKLTKNKKVLEIGTGSGLIALCALQAGASSVIATDVNSNALECAAYNANRLKLIDRLKLRKVEPGNQNAYVSISKEERFDLIISNPPWEDSVPKKIDEFALYDTNFALLDSLLSKAPDHLNPNGEVYLAYGCKTAILRMVEWAKQHQWKHAILDDRKLEEVTEVFLPGMLVKLSPP